MGLFETMVQNMQRMEFFQYLFPFLLAFALLYGLMRWAFKDNLGGVRVQTLIAVVLAFFVMLYSSYNTWLYTLLTNVSGVWLGLATVVLFIVLFAQLVGLGLPDILSGEKRSWLKYLIILIIVWIALSVFLGFAGYSQWIPYWLTGSDLWTVILVVVIIAIVFAFVGKEDSGADAGEAPAAGRTTPETK